MNKKFILFWTLLWAGVFFLSFFLFYFDKINYNQTLFICTVTALMLVLVLCIGILKNKPAKAVKENRIVVCVAWSYDDAQSQYCMKNRIKRNEVTDEDKKIITEYARTHIGYLIQWLIEKNYLVVKDDNEKLTKYLEDINSKKIKPTELLSLYYNDVLTEADISPKIVDFILDYYPDDYLYDYELFVTEELKSELYNINFNFDDYDRFKKYINEEYQIYLNNK